MLYIPWLLRGLLSHKRCPHIKRRSNNSWLYWFWLDYALCVSSLFSCAVLSSLLVLSFQQPSRWEREREREREREMVALIFLPSWCHVTVFVLWLFINADGWSAEPMWLRHFLIILTYFFVVFGILWLQIWFEKSFTSFVLLYQPLYDGTPRLRICTSQCESMCFIVYERSTALTCMATQPIYTGLIKDI